MHERSTSIQSLSSCLRGPILRRRSAVTRRRRGAQDSLRGTEIPAIGGKGRRGIPPYGGGGRPSSY